MALKVLRDLRSSGAYSDITIRCSQHEFKVHQNIICPRSPYFTAACEGKPEEESENAIVLDAKEKKPRSIDLDSDDPYAISLMIDYLYMDDYDFGQYPESNINGGSYHADLAIDTSSVDAKDGISGVAPEANGTVEQASIGELSPDQPADSKARFDGRHSHDITTVSKVVLGTGRRLSIDQSHAELPERHRRRHGKTPKRQRARIQEAPRTAKDSDQALTVHAKLYALGSKYMIPDLQKEALAKFRKILDGDFSMPGLASAIPHIFGGTAQFEQGLQGEVLQFIIERLVDVLQHNEIQDAIQRIDGLAFELLKGHAFNSPRVGVSCANCNTSLVKKCSNALHLFVPVHNSFAPDCEHYFVSCECDKFARCGTCRMK